MPTQLKYRLIPVEGDIVAGQAEVNGPLDARARAHAALGTDEIGWLRAHDDGVIKDMAVLAGPHSGDEPLNERATAILNAHRPDDAGVATIHGPAFIIDSGRVDAIG